MGWRCGLALRTGADWRFGQARTGGAPSLLQAAAAMGGGAPLKRVVAVGDSLTHDILGASSAGAPTQPNPRANPAYGIALQR